jgi:hypothetical protein
MAVVVDKIGRPIKASSNKFIVAKVILNCKAI